MPPIRVAAHVDVRYTTRRPTGVDKHIARMVHGLAGRPGFELSVVAPRSQLVAGRLPDTSSLCGLPVHPIPFSNRLGRAIWSVASFPAIDRFCPGVDWVWSPQELWAPARHARTAVTIHGCTWFEPTCPDHESPWARWERLRLGRFFDRVCRRADLVLPVSPYLERFLVAHHGLSRDRSVVVGNGVDTPFFRAGAQAMAAGANQWYDRDKVLVVGGLNAWDGVDSILAAADALSARLPSVSIDVVGTMDDARAAARCDRRPNIRRLGFRSPVDLAAMMPSYLSLLYLPNVESFGIVPLESMAAALPVLACRLTAVPETAGDGAWYVDHDRPESVVDAVAALRGDPGLRQAWIDRGRRRAAGFTWEACVDRLADAFRQPSPMVGSGSNGCRGGRA
jgi:alpha-1,3-rhamnosyl/mannosyltransferase